jgi:uncharacterized protein YjiS (DUF1127 family)
MIISNVTYKPEDRTMNDSILCISNSNSINSKMVTFKVLALQFLKRCYVKNGTRKQLAKLDQHLLQDIGICSADAYKEANKGFWK